MPCDLADAQTSHAAAISGLISSPWLRPRLQVKGGPIARVELRYETAATLVLRGVLDPEGDPQHKRIVDMYACESFPEGGPQHKRTVDKYACENTSRGPHPI